MERRKAGLRGKGGREGGRERTDRETDRQTARERLSDRENRDRSGNSLSPNDKDLSKFFLLVKKQQHKNK